MNFGNLVVSAYRGILMMLTLTVCCAVSLQFYFGLITRLENIKFLFKYY